MHFACVSALNHQTDLGALFRAHQVMMNRRRQEQRRNRSVNRVGVAVGEHDHTGTLIDRFRDLGKDLVERTLQRRPATSDSVETLDDVRLKTREFAVVVGVDDFGQLVVVDDRERKRELSTAFWTGVEHVRLRPDRRRHRRHHFFTDRIERRVRDLGEQLLEVIEQQPRPLRQHSDRRVGSHRAERLISTLRHRCHDDLEFLVCVPKHLLPT